MIIGLAVMAIGVWLVLDWHNMSCLLAMPLGLFIVSYGIDVIGHPERRSALRPREMADFVLRFSTGVGPADP